MNREIKFQAWDRELNVMRDFKNAKDGIQYCIGEFWVSNGWNGFGDPTYDADTTNRYEIMQYTGLKDKTGKEIYEEDILSDSRRGIVSEVLFNDSSFHLAYMSPSENSGFSLFCEVIGNRFENPELLDAT
jgi:hypothetical protein